VATNKEKLIAGAQKLVEKGSFDKAIKEYLKVVQEDESDVRVWLKIGDLYAKLSRRSEATETYQRVAQFYSDQGFYLKSVAVYKQILKIDPRLFEVNIRLAELYKQLGLLSDAVQQFEAVAAFFQKEGRVQEALATIKQIVDLDPETVANRIKLAELYSKEQMPREAVDEFSKAAEQLKGAGRIDDFMKVAERLLFHSPDNKPVTKELARLYIEKGDPRRALPKLQVLFKGDPRDVEVLGLLASAFESLDQRPKAVSVLKEQARILGENGDEKERADVARKVLALSPGDPDAEAILGRARPERHSTASKRTGSSADARVASSATRRLTAFPSSREFDDRPSTRDTGAGGALEALRPDEDHFPEDKTAVVAPDRGEEAISKILNETDVYIKYNLHAKAIEHLQRVFERKPRHQLAREKLKALYLMIGKREEAVLELWALAESAEPGRQRRYLREILEIDPQNVRAAERLGERPSRAIEVDSRMLPVRELDSAEILIEEPTRSGITHRSHIEHEPSLVSLDPPPNFDVSSPQPAQMQKGNFRETDASEDTVASISRSSFEEPVDELDVVEEVPKRPLVLASAANLDDDLDEADFFIQQSLFEEARALLEGLRERHPAHAQIEAKLDELNSLEIHVIDVSTASMVPSKQLEWTDRLTDRFTDLAAEPPGESAARLDSAEPLLDLTHREVVERGVSAEDFETHYDLGIAYKEMGLLSDAIGEFQLVMKDRAREVQCHLMVGLCYIQKDLINEAIAQFKKGLYVEGINDRESLTLYFELGQAYERLGDSHEAFYYYDKVQKREPRFREVERRISILRGEGPSMVMSGAPSVEDLDVALDSLLGEDA
jgi:tetratricopeptide (TPR) repeat protein